MLMLLHSFILLCSQRGTKQCAFAAARRGLARVSVFVPADGGMLLSAFVFGDVRCHVSCVHLYMVWGERILCCTAYEANDISLCRICRLLLNTTRPITFAIPSLRMYFFSHLPVLFAPWLTATRMRICTYTRKHLHTQTHADISNGAYGVKDSAI